MPKPVEPLVIRAEFTQDPASGEWIATAMQSPRLSARALDLRRAREALASQLTERLGVPVQIEDKVKLPDGLSKEVAAYQRDLAQMQTLKASLDERFMPLLDSLKRQRLQDQQIARLLGISKQRLSSILKEQATGAFRKRDE